MGLIIQKQLVQEIDTRKVFSFLSKMSNGFQKPLIKDRKSRTWQKWVLVIIVIVFILAFMLGWTLRCHVYPCFWAKTSLTVQAIPESQVRGANITFAGALLGEDIVTKTIALTVTDPNGDLLQSFTAITDENGYYTHVCTIPTTCSPGKYTVSASYEGLTSQHDFFVKLVAPQKQG